MNDIEIQAIFRSLQLFHKPTTSLEWGSGNSTLYFSAHAPPGSEWISIEHDAEWAVQTRAMINEFGTDKICLYHVPNISAWHEGMDDGNYDSFRDYIFFPSTLEKKFQWILIDGRARIECMKIGWMLLDYGGIMILHDAQRTQYSRGIPSDSFFLKIINPLINIEGNISLLFMSKSSYVIKLLSEALTRRLPDYIQFEADNYTSSYSQMEMSWGKIKGLALVRLYAGDVPNFVEYEGLVGLSLTTNDYRHIKHDISHPFPLPDNSVDSFQAEDVLEHIDYDNLLPIINEIHRVLKPGSIFRLSLPDYGCDVVTKRSIKSSSGKIIFDPWGGGTVETPGHIWFPRVDNVMPLLQKTEFARRGKIEYLHNYNTDGSFVANPIDYSKGYIQRTPDYDLRVRNPYRPMSMVIDLMKGPS
jgi:SAM-dependent methyltransferase